MSVRPEPSWAAELRAEVSRRLRAQKATQIGLADYLGITPKHVNQLLRGHVTGTAEMLDALAGAVGLRITVEESGEPVPRLAGRKPSSRALGRQREQIAAAILAEQVPCPAHDGDQGTFAAAGCVRCDRNAALARAADVARDTPGGPR
jgi:transcriptional regulator with XRE-family HTH domain